MKLIVERFSEADPDVTFRSEPVETGGHRFLAQVVVVTCVDGVRSEHALQPDVAAFERRGEAHEFGFRYAELWLRCQQKSEVEPASRRATPV